MMKLSSVIVFMFKKTRLKYLLGFLQAIRKVPLLSELGSQKLAKIVDAVEEETFRMGDYIIRQGENGDTFYMIMSGEVDITMVGQEYSDSIQDPSPKEKYVRTMGKGESFGEKALQSDSGLRSANVIAKTEIVKCMTLDKQSFSQLIGTLAEKDPTRKRMIKSPSNQRQSTSSNASGRTSINRIKRPSSSAIMDMPARRMPANMEGYALSDFQFVGVLGVGGFGRVELVCLRDQPDKTFALKCMKKVSEIYFFASFFVAIAGPILPQNLNTSKMFFVGFVIKNNTWTINYRREYEWTFGATQSRKVQQFNPCASAKN